MESSKWEQLGLLAEINNNNNNKKSIYYLFYGEKKLRAMKSIDSTIIGNMSSFFYFLL